MGDVLGQSRQPFPLCWRQKHSRHGGVSCLSKRVSETGHHGPLQITAYSQYKEVITKEFLHHRDAIVPQKQVAIHARVSTLDKG